MGKLSTIISVAALAGLGYYVGNNAPCIKGLPLETMLRMPKELKELLTAKSTNPSFSLKKLTLLPRKSFSALLSLQ